jgi:hypothetical protein
MKITYSDELVAMMKVGAILRVQRNLPGREYVDYHVRAIVDEVEIVVRHWSPKNGWTYQVKNLYEFKLMHDGGKLKLHKEGKGETQEPHN